MLVGQMKWTGRFEGGFFGESGRKTLYIGRKASNLVHRVV
jgi:hypothetical protein